MNVASSEAPVDDEVQARSAPAPKISTSRALVFVYLAYVFRYVYLLILVPFYGRVLGTAGYGRVLAGMSLFQVVWIAAEGGFFFLGARDVAATESNQERAALYGRHQGGRVLMIVPAALIGIIGTYSSPVLSEQPLYGLLATANGLLTAFNLGWYFQGTLQFRTGVWVELVGFTLNLMFVLSAVNAPEDAWLVLLSLALSTFCSLAVSHWLVVRSFAGAPIRFAGALRLVRDSFVMGIYRALATVTTNASPYIYSTFASAAEVGLYGSAERVASVGLSLIQPAHQVIFSTVSKRVSRADDEQSGYRMMKLSLLALFACGAVMLIGAQLLAGWILPLILGPDFVAAVPVLRALSWMFPFEALNLVLFGAILIPLRLDKTVTWLSAVYAVVVVTLIWLLGHPFGGMGVAYSRVVASGLSVVVVFDLLRRRGILQRIIKA